MACERDHAHCAWLPVLGAGSVCRLRHGDLLCACGHLWLRYVALGTVSRRGREEDSRVAHHPFPVAAHFACDARGIGVMGHHLLDSDHVDRQQRAHLRQFHDSPEHGGPVGSGSEICRAMVALARCRCRLHSSLHLQADTIHRLPIRLLHRYGHPWLPPVAQKNIPTEFPPIPYFLYFPYFPSPPFLPECNRTAACRRGDVSASWRRPG